MLWLSDRDTWRGSRRQFPRWATRQHQYHYTALHEARSQNWKLYVAAAAAGIALNALFLLFDAWGSTFVHLWWPAKQNLLPWPDPQCISPALCRDVRHTPLRDQGRLLPATSSFAVPGEDKWSVDAIREMVSTTKGYYARDYSVALGWNNMRYIIEAAALHAKLLNRTLVIPTKVYARSCEWSFEVCAAYAPQVNRADAIGIPEWKGAPIEQQMGWVIPIEVMLDLKVLREHVPTITVSEYLTLHGLDASLETTNGKWDPVAYHNTSSIPPPTLVTIPNNRFDPLNITRVDRLPREAVEKYPAPAKGSKEAKAMETMSWGFLKFLTMDLEDFKKSLFTHTKEQWNNEEEMVPMLGRYELGVLYTFRGRTWNPEKTVVEPIRVVAPLHSMRGLVDDFGGHTEDVLYVPGELHDTRVPGFLFFTSTPPRDDFATMVLRGVVHTPPVELLAEAVAAHMLRLNDGRMWIAAHWRRTDFVKWHLALGGDTYQGGMHRILIRLEDGTKMLRQIAEDGSVEVADIPGVAADCSFRDKPPPQIGDRWFLSTDERSPEVLAYARANNATLISDLLAETPHLRRLFGWPMLYTDTLGLVEQGVMARAAFFFAHYRSSLAGGVVNLRGIRGMDPRTMILDD